MTTHDRTTRAQVVEENVALSPNRPHGRDVEREAPPSLGPPGPELAGLYRFVWESIAGADVPLGADVLDVGCGPGFLLAPLSRAGMRSVGLEMRPDTAGEARAAAPLATIMLADGLRLPFADRSFDIVVMLEVLEHVSDEVPLLSEAHRVLRPGGLLILTTPHAGRWKFLDPDNFKFRAPWLHRIGYGLLGRGDEYRRRFEGTTFGSFATQGRKPWHRHYTVDEVCSLAEGLEARTTHLSGGLVFTLALVASYFSVKLFGRWVWPIPRLLTSDDREVPHGYQLAMTFRRTTP